MKLEEVISLLDSKRLKLEGIVRENKEIGERKLKSEFEAFDDLLFKEFGVKLNTPLNVLVVIGLINTILDRREKEKNEA